MAFNVGETAGDYQIIGILGAGGMGKVYKVRNTISDRVEAMKVLLPDLANEAELADRFMREIKLLASLNHPNIAQLHTAMRLDNQLLMIMEFVEGRTLEDRLKEGPVPPRDAVQFACQTLSALGYAHERGVIHRDIKPANMMLTADGQLKLMDFGIAKAVADRRLTQTGTTLGSLYYMSPEQVKGSTEIDGRSDLYSVGVSLYELVTGTRPFKGDSDYSIMVAHLEQQAVPPIQLDPSFPPALNEIIMVAIEKDPNKRFQTAQAFRAALESVVGSLPQVAAMPQQPFAQPPGAPLPTMTARPLAQPQPPQMAPPPPQFQAPAPPMPQAPPMMPPMPPPPAAVATQRSGHRGVWMALGALLLLGVLAAGAVFGPKWYRARAGSSTPSSPESTPAAATETPAATPAAPPTEPVAAPAIPESASGMAQPTALAPVSTPEPAASAAPAPARSSSSRASRRSAPASGGYEQAPSMSSAPSYSPPPTPAAQESAPAAPAVDTAALEEAQERMSALTPRANALRSSLQNLERQQRSMGVGLRTDIAASWHRMEGLLDEAEAAIKAGNPARAKTKLDQAEREADKIDKFLGH